MNGWIDANAALNRRGEGPMPALTAAPYPHARSSAARPQSLAP